MRSIMGRHKSGQKKSSGQDSEITLAPKFVFDESYEQSVIEYNKNVLKLDDEYLNLTPRSKILVRVFLNELEKTEGGVLIPNREMVQAPTANGVGVVGEIESPFPYSRKAVVVSIPHFVTDLSPGDIVLLSKRPVEAIALGKGDNASIRIPYGFTHPDLYKKEGGIPTDPKDRNYGYLTVPTQELEFTLNKAK